MREALLFTILYAVFLTGCSEHCIPEHKCPGPCVAEEYGDSNKISNLDRYFYNENNRLTHAELDYKADGRVDTVWKGTYDAEGNLIKSEFDDDDDGTVDQRSTFTWDANGNQLTSEFDFDGDGPGGPWWIWVFVYDYLGTLLMEDIDFAADGVVDGRLIYRYDQNGCPVKKERFCFGELCNVEDTIQTCDERGNILTSETPTWKVTYTYDQNDILLVEETEDNEGIERLVYKYDEYGNLLKKQRERQDGVGDFKIIGHVTFRYDCWCR